MSLPRLSRSLAGSPPARPERILQFGTGAFMRGFADVFIDEACRAGRYDGRVVLVGSTGSGRASALTEQDGLYTLCVRGLEGGQPVDEAHVVASVSRALSAGSEWESVLDVARSPALQIVVSNTTEVGIADDLGDRRDLDPPRSFPGKLAAVLATRAEAFDYDPDYGVVVLPCELIKDNGDRLAEIVSAHAERWSLDRRFQPWLDRSVHFCNTLVDRIVPGTPDDPGPLEERLGYRDSLLTVAEPYRLWAIEATPDAAARLPFAHLDGVVVTRDVAPYRERKVRILNGGHSATVPLALLCGLGTVAEMLADEALGAFVRAVVMDEIVPALDADSDAAEAFARDVLERFANPFIRHDLRGILLQQTMKVRVRVVPSIVGFAEATGRTPACLAFGFAAFLATTRPGALPGDVPADDAGGVWRDRWAAFFDSSPEALRQFALAACADSGLWGTDLSAVPGFAEAVADALVRLDADGPREALQAHLAEAA